MARSAAPAVDGTSPRAGQPPLPLVRFLLHGAERSGPPIYIARLLRFWAAQPPPFRTELVVARPGPLLSVFDQLSATTVARTDSRSALGRADRLAEALHLSRSGAISRRVTRGRLRRSAPTLTVVNGATAPTVELLRALRPAGEVLTIAHELSTGWYGNLGASDRSLLLGRTDRFLAVSRAVERYLVEDLGVGRDRVTVINPPIDLAELADVGTPTGEGRPTVVGSGMTDWRKAPEIWLRVAAEVKASSKDAAPRFLWIGGHAPDDPGFWPLEHETRHLDLSEDVRFLGQISDPVRHLLEATVFVSTAREDAYPLACAEAAAMGIPVVGFDGGGVAELVAASGGGAVFPFPRHDLIAKEVSDLLQDPGRRQELGERGRAFARAELDVGVIAPAVAQWISGVRR